jgi:tetratricopeptide (TPR) repeat protein
MTPAKRDGKTCLYRVVVAFLFVVLVGCYPSNMSWNSLKFWQTPKQGKAMNDKAVARFLGQIRARPDNPDSHFRLASYYQERGLYREAIAEYSKVIMINPTYIKAYNSKGICHDQVGEHQEAISCFEKAITLDDGLDYVWNNICYSYFLQGHYEKAIAACEKAVSLNSGNIRMRNNLAMVLGMAGYYERAFREFETASGGDKIYAHLKMASIYNDKAMFAKAVEQYKVALSLNPKSEAAQKGLIASGELVRIADAAKIQDESNKRAAEKANKQTGENAIMKTAGTVLDETKAVEEFAFAQKLYEEGAFKEAFRHFEQSYTLNPRLNSATKGMAAAEALTKIAEAPSRKTMISTTDRKSTYNGSEPSVSGRVGIEVSNGNGKRHMARDIGKYLRNKGFNVVSLSNACHFNYDSGSILYEREYKNIAEEIAERIPQLSEIKEVDKTTRSNVKVMVIIGKDLVAVRQHYRN